MFEKNKFKFINSEGKEEIVLRERWGWGVIYKPTQDAIDDAEIKLKERNDNLYKEMCEKEQRLIKIKVPNVNIQNMFKLFKARMNEPIDAYQKELHQFDGDGNFHQFKEIDLKNVSMFTMYRTDDMSKRIDMPIVEGMQFFHFYRNFKPYYDQKGGFRKIYVFGWKFKGVASYNFILPDDRMIVSPVDNIDLVNFNV